MPIASQQFTEFVWKDIESKKRRDIREADCIAYSFTVEEAVAPWHLTVKSVKSSIAFMHVVVKIFSY